MADKDWGILNDVYLAVAGSGLVRQVRLGSGPKAEEAAAMQLPACFVDYAGTDEYPSGAGESDLFSVLRFKLLVIVKGQEEAARVESAAKLANDLKDALMADRFRSGRAAYGPAQKPTEFGKSSVSSRHGHPFTAIEIEGTCGFYTSEVAR
jgi:hypothetical protein